jgi:glycosyltransferase involved in cell wall biosynthesis
MHIAYITHQRLPNNDTSSIQLVQTAAALARTGATVDLHFPARGAAALRPPTAWRAALAEHYKADIRFEPRVLGMDGVPGVWEKWVHARRALHQSRADHPDVVYTRDQWPAAFALRLGLPVILEYYRPLPDLPWFRRNIIRRFLAHPLCLGLITHSEFARRGYLAAGVPSEKVRTIYNGFDPAAFRIARTPGEARAALSLPEAPTVTYAGRIAAMKGVGLLLDAAAASPGVQWVIAGDKTSPEAEPLVSRGAELGNVRFPGYLTGESLTLVLQAGDALVIPPSAAPLERYRMTVLPIKIFQYLAAGRPILCGDLPDTAELLQADVTSVRLPPDDASALAVAAIALTRDRERAARLGSAARDLAAGLTWDARGRRILEYIAERRRSLSADLAQ